MLARINTITFNGLEILDVDLQIQVASGLPAFNIVGLPDKAIAESQNLRQGTESTIYQISQFASIFFA